MMENSLKSFLNHCEKADIIFSSVVENEPKAFVLLHSYLESNHVSIVAFSDSYSELVDIMLLHPRYGSFRHDFLICNNSDCGFVIPIKDKSLINICKNVAEFLALGEYAMLKKSYFKSAAWFEKAKHSASLGADIINNY